MQCGVRAALRPRGYVAAERGMGTNPGNDEGLHLAYRKGVCAAAWVMRWYASDKTLQGRDPARNKRPAP